jgi:hypothetical protein
VPRRIGSVSARASAAFLDGIALWPARSLRSWSHAAITDVLDGRPDGGSTWTLKIEAA